MLGGERMNIKRDVLVSLRKEQKWFQKDVVDILKMQYSIEITESYYGMIEQGVRTPKLEIALALSNLFKVQPGDIFFEQNHNKKLG
jgi:putative transcriptional regulator